MNGSKKSGRYVNADHFINRLIHGLDEEVRERGNNFPQDSGSSFPLPGPSSMSRRIAIPIYKTANIDTETEP